MDTKLIKGSFVFLKKSIMAMSGRKVIESSMQSFQLSLDLKRGEGREREKK